MVTGTHLIILMKDKRCEKPRRVAPKIKVWKLKEEPVRNRLCENFVQLIEAKEIKEDVESTWNDLKEALLGSCALACGKTKGGPPQRRETWWWDDTVENAIKTKRRLWKTWKKGGSKEEYLRAKKSAKAAVYVAKRSSQEHKFGELRGKDQINLVFKHARKMKFDNSDIV